MRCAAAVLCLWGWAATGKAQPATPAFADLGGRIDGGCDDAAAGTDPLFNGGVNEFYTKYMDAGEVSAYTVVLGNLTGEALTDVTVALSFGGPGASRMTAFENPVHLGRVPIGATAGAVFPLVVDPGAPALTPVALQFDVTSPADGYTVPLRITHALLLQANDVVTRHQRCSTFTTQADFDAWYESPVGGHALSAWRWSGSATSPGTVGSETIVDTVCGDATPNTAAMVGNSGTTAGNNFNGNSDSFLLQRFQPALTGNGPSGQPYRYAWTRHSFYHSSETPGASTGVWGVFYDDRWNQPVDPTGDQAAAFPISLGHFAQTIFDNGTSWNWGAGNQLVVTFENVSGFATPETWFAYGHEHADVTVFGGASSATSRRDIAFDDDVLVYDEFYADGQAGPSCGPQGQIGLVAFDSALIVGCPTGTARVNVVDANAAGPLVATVTSPGTGDSETVVLSGSGPYFAGTIAISTRSGQGSGNGTLFVLPNEQVTATYVDDAPAGTSTALASIGIEVPAEAPALTVSRSGTVATIRWTMAAGATKSDLLRGLLSALPVGPGGADETCFDDLPDASLDDAAIPSAGAGYWYLVRGETACGGGTWGDKVLRGVATARSSTTCP